MQASAVEVGIDFEFGDLGDALEEVDQFVRLKHWQLPHGGVKLCRASPWPAAVQILPAVLPLSDRGHLDSTFSAHHRIVSVADEGGEL
jgi:hypothetical protein